MLRGYIVGVPQHCLLLFIDDGVYVFAEDLLFFYFHLLLFIIVLNHPDVDVASLLCNECTQHITYTLT